MVNSSVFNNPSKDIQCCLCYYHIDHYKKKMFNNAYIVIEDSPENLERSNAKHKILIRHRYNDEYAKANPHIHVARDFNHATQIALTLL